MNGIYVGNLSWTLKLPNGRDMTNLFPYLDHGNMFVIYSDGYKDITFVDLHNFKYEKIKSTLQDQINVGLRLLFLRFKVPPYALI